MESSSESSGSGRPHHHGKHSAPVETAQMSVLGRDGRDLESSSFGTPVPSSRAKQVAAMVSSNSSNNNWRPPSPFSQEHEVETQNRSSSWWDGLTTTASRWHLTKKAPNNSNPNASPVHEALEAAYASFDDESLASTLSATPQPQDVPDDFVKPKKHRRSNSRRSHGRTSNKNNAVTFSLLQPQLEEGVELTGDDTESSLTKEDKVRQDCSFFYRDLDDEPSPRHARKNKLSMRNTRGGISCDSYAEMMQLEPSRAAFQARYDQLNAQHVIHDDLEFFEEDDEEPKLLHGNNSPQFPRVAQFSNSSLFYRHDGKVLMRLPQDKVRLIMDSQLEAGILSMECEQYKKTGEPWKEQELTYVLTVDGHLYRRVLKEMADSYKTPCGLYYCCQEAESTGHVHIGIAIGLLFCVLIFLFVNTMVWPY